MGKERRQSPDHARQDPTTFRLLTPRADSLAPACPVAMRPLSRCGGTNSSRRFPSGSSLLVWRGEGEGGAHGGDCVAATMRPTLSVMIAFLGSMRLLYDGCGNSLVLHYLKIYDLRGGNFLNRLPASWDGNKRKLTRKWKAMDAGFSTERTEKPDSK